MKQGLLVCLLCLGLLTCVNSPLEKKAVSGQDERNTWQHLAKGNLDRMADVEIRENIDSLKRLMVKLYKRNPRELRKSTSESGEKFMRWVFNAEEQHHYQFELLDNKQGTDALYLALNADYGGDRVLALIIGLHTMLLKAHGGKTDFYFTDSIDPQSLYNIARNFEIAAWKLGQARDKNGQLLLISNELLGDENNLSFEREFGKIIGRLDLIASILSEKSQRMLSNATFSLATAVFLPF